jgi:hypothetical protein
VLAASWGPVDGVPQLRADIDNDGTVGVADLLLWSQEAGSTALLVRSAGGGVTILPAGGGPPIPVPGAAPPVAERSPGS